VLAGSHKVSYSHYPPGCLIGIVEYRAATAFQPTVTFSINPAVNKPFVVQMHLRVHKLGGWRRSFLE
jgi:hypothetical protein